MLRQLTIRDFALIAHLELEFVTGFSVLTGETGAGKSILLDALQLVLGGRASAGQLKAGGQKVDIAAIFDVSQRPRVLRWLSDHDLDGDDDLLLRRVVGPDGRSRAYINGIQTAVQKLRELGDQLVEIHGQHEFQTLVKPAEQMRLLDLFGNCKDAGDKVLAQFNRWRGLQAELETLRRNAAMSPAELELLRHQVEELERVAVAPEDLEALHQEHRTLSNAESLMKTTGDAADALAGGLTDQLADLVQSLRREAASLKSLDEPADLLESALLSAQEAESVLSRQLRELEANPQRVAALDSQLDQIHSLARKHRVSAEDLAQHLDTLQQRFAAAEHADEQEQALLTQLEACQADYLAVARTLSGQRKKAAKKFAAAVTSTIREVGMDQAEFQIQVEFDGDGPPNRHGLDAVRYLIQTNPGSSAGSLDQVASGGELSRVALGLKVALAQMESGRTMIFDEVDAGVGGATAQRVGQKLRRLASQAGKGSRGRKSKASGKISDSSAGAPSGQVLSVTHLPQVAACGHQHYRVEKHQGKKDTATTVKLLDDDQRLDELARMLGGVTITQQTKAHAAEMLASAEADS